MATMTAAQMRERAKREYNAFVAACPSQQLLRRISDKWATLVLAALGGGSDCTGEPAAMRYSELSRVLAGVSPKMLTQTLRNLERDGLISRTVTATVPVTVSYELTALGLSLYETVRQLKLWAEDHMGEVLAHRAASEEATSGPL
ncbi:winged helix-turn-helix transcriptional regulator [Rhodococcus zopfii]|uniref:winged helix-turn-helix transcriptional regulator n=1 Tax=Rhodococcus zopfii TaxID=43772 RepID=UPI0035273F5F